MNENKSMQDLYKEYRQSLYRDYPEVDRFEKRKRRWFWFLFLYCLLLGILRAVFLRQMGASLVALVVGTVMGTGMHLIFLAGAMGWRWKVACILYLWFLVNMVNLISTMARQGITSWEAFRWAYVDGFSQYPLAISCDVLSWGFILLLLPTAMWLTLVPANRRMAEESERLNEQLKQFMLSHPS